MGEYLDALWNDLEQTWDLAMKINDLSEKERGDVEACAMAKLMAGSVGWPDWLARGNATLIEGQRILGDDSERRLSDVWYVKAGQENYMFHDSVTGLPVGYLMNMTADELSGNPLFKAMLAEMTARVTKKKINIGGGLLFFRLQSLWVFL